MATDNRFQGLYRGVCVSNADPEQRGRITLRVPQLLGNATTDWAWRCVPPGWDSALVQPHDITPYTGAPNFLPHTLQAKTPAVGQGVWVMFEAGDPDLPVWIGVF